MATQETPQPGTFYLPRVVLIGFSHFSIDVYSSFLIPLLPLLLVKFHLSLALVGVLVSVNALTSGLGQPFFGFLADKFRSRIFIMGGPIIASFFICQIGRAWSYGSLIAVMMLCSIGAAIFHPQAAAIAGQVSGSRRGLGVSIFMMGGRFGYSAGPVIAAFVAARYGLERLHFAFIPILLVVALLFLYCPKPVAPSRKVNFRNLGGILKEAGKPLLNIWVIEVLRSGLMSALASFLPLLFTQKGYGLVAAGATSTIFLASGAIGGMLGGHISDRLGRRNVILVSLVVAVPLFYAFLHTSGAVGLVFLSLTGFTLLSTLAVTIALAQETLPASASMASSFMLGFAWLTGSLLSVLVGFLGDYIGIPGAFNVIGIAVPIAALLARRLPDDSRLRSGQPASLDAVTRP